MQVGRIILACGVLFAGCSGAEHEERAFDYLYFDATSLEGTLGTRYVAAFAEFGPCLTDYCGLGGDDCTIAADACDADAHDEPIVECEVTVASTTINTQGATSIAFFRMEFDISATSLADGWLPFGPLPTATTAGCEPVVKPGSVHGFDGMKNEIWQASTFDPTEVTVGVDHVVLVEP